MRTIKRIAGTIAVLGLVSVLLLAVVPTRGEAIVAFDPPGTEISGDVDCGSLLRSTRWSHADGCDGPLLTRGGLIVLAGLIGVVAAMTAFGLWLAEWRRRT